MLHIEEEYLHRRGFLAHIDAEFFQVPGAPAKPAPARKKAKTKKKPKQKKEKRWVKMNREHPVKALRWEDEG